MRADRKRQIRNLKIQSELKTLTRKFLQHLQAKEVEPARASLALLTKRIDQAQTKKIMHRNTASRRKGRLAHRFARLSSPR